VGSTKDRSGELHAGPTAGARCQPPRCSLRKTCMNIALDIRQEILGNGRGPVCPDVDGAAIDLRRFGNRQHPARGGRRPTPESKRCASASAQTGFSRSRKTEKFITKSPLRIWARGDGDAFLWLFGHHPQAHRSGRRRVFLKIGMRGSCRLRAKEPAGGWLSPSSGRYDAFRRFPPIFYRPRGVPPPPPPPPPGVICSTPTPARSSVSPPAGDGHDTLMHRPRGSGAGRAMSQTGFAGA